MEESRGSTPLRTYSALLMFLFWLVSGQPLFAQSLPRIATGGVINAAGFPFRDAPVAPGTIISIYGTNFNQASGIHAGAASATTLPLPTVIDGVQVLLNARPAPLVYVDSSQINAVVPWEVRGASSLTVQTLLNGVPSNLATVALADQAPGVFVVTHVSDGTVVSPSNPAVPGEYLTIYCAGLGNVSNQPATGAAARGSDNLSTTVILPEVHIGSSPANVVFSGLTPGFVGLYQVNVQVPANAPHGNAITVVLSSTGVVSNTVTVGVQSDLASPVQVSLSPSTVTLPASGTQQFTAAVADATDVSVSWSVNGIPGGSSSVGTISTTGLYTAPATAPAGNIVFVSATSAADPAVAGTATVLVRAVAIPQSPVGRYRVSTAGLYVGDIERRGGTGGYASGYLIQHFAEFDSLLGHTVGAEAALQFDAMKGMGVNAITFDLNTVDADATGPFDGGTITPPPACLGNLVLGLDWPQPTAAELTNLKAFFDLAQSKGIRIRLRLSNTHMEEQPPANSQTWLGAILGVVGKHAALDIVTFDGAPHLMGAEYNYTPPICGLPAEPRLDFGPTTVPAQYIKWAIGYAMSLGIPARKLSAEAIVGSLNLEGPAGPNYTDFHVWSPIVTLKSIFDSLGIPDNQRTYAISLYEARRCTASPAPSCTDADPDTSAEQTLQHLYGVIGTGNGARVLATEMGDSSNAANWRAENAMESLVRLMEKYGIEGGSFYWWVNTVPGEADPTVPDAVKRRGVAFVYNPVEKEVVDMGGFHLIAIPNASFEDDLDSQGLQGHWSVSGSGAVAAYFLAQELGQPAVPSRGSYCLRLSTSSTGNSAISATSDAVAVSPGTAYTTAANLRFAWSGDPNPSASPSTRPQVFVAVHYLGANGAPTADPPSIFRYFQENITQGFQTFVFQYTTPNGVQAVRIEVGAVQYGLTTPIVLDVDNLR
jgi:uncharacterized protein (TIGR03437 family)